MSKKALRRHHRNRLIRKFIRDQGYHAHSFSSDSTEWLFKASRRYTSTRCLCSCYLCKSGRSKYGNGRYSKTFAELNAIDDLRTALLYQDWDMEKETIDVSNENYRTALLQRVVKTVVEVFDVSEKEVSESTNFENDYGADSLDIIELVIILEDEFAIELSDDVSERIETVKDAVDAVAQVLAERRAAA